MIYSKESLSKAKANPKAQNIYYNGSHLKGREWNRYVAGYILDEFLDNMSSEDSLEFIQYDNVLSFTQAGMFDTVYRYLTSVVIPALKSDVLKDRARMLADNLHSSDDTSS